MPRKKHIATKHAVPARAAWASREAPDQKYVAGLEANPEALEWLSKYESDYHGRPSKKNNSLPDDIRRESYRANIAASDDIMTKLASEAYRCDDLHELLLDDDALDPAQEFELKEMLLERIVEEALKDPRAEHEARMLATNLDDYWLRRFEQQLEIAQRETRLSETRNEGDSDEYPDQEATQHTDLA